MKSSKKITLLLIIGLLGILCLTACSKVEFKINFMVDGDIYRTINTNGSEVLKMPNDPQKEGFEFDGWFWDDNSWQRPFTANSLLDAPLSENLNVYAKWITASSLVGTQAAFEGFTKIKDGEYYIKVSNNTSTISFSDIIQINSRSNWTLSSDIYGNNTIASKTATLAVGNNAWYVLVTANDNTTKLYTLTIRRRPIYDVVFNTNQGTSVATQYVEEDSYATEPITSRIGYDFSGWNYDFQLPINDNKTITAQWTAKKGINVSFDITTNGGNGTQPDDLLNLTYDSEYGILPTAALFTKTGYTFNGWFTSAFGGSKISATTIVKNLEAHTLYAQWITDTYSITYVLDDGENGNNPKSYTYESSEITLEDANKLGYTFEGWYTDSSFETRVYIIPAQSSENKTFYAKFDIETYTISYELDGGSHSGNPTTYKIETDTIVLKDASKTGYTFSGWYNSNNQKITSIPKGSTGNINLEALFSLNNYAISYTLNGGTHTGNPTSYNVESSTITFNDPIRTNYTFAGWFTESAFQNQITSITTGSRTGAIALYAKWVSVLTFDTRGGAAVNNMQVQASTQIGTLPITARDNWTFDGWYSTATGTGTQYQNTTTPTGNATIYARWSSVITFDSQAGTTLASLPIKFGIASSFAANPTKTGYTFDGWWTEIGGSGNQYTSILDDYAYGNLTLYANWNANKYKIMFDYQNGTGNPSSIQATFDSQVGDLPSPIKAGNNIFGGWFTSVGGAGTQYFASTTYKQTTDITLYAKWTTEITFNYDGATSDYATTKIPVIYNTKVGTLPRPYKDGYSFEGWYDESNSEYLSGTTFRALGEVALKAKWIEGTDKNYFVYSYSNNTNRITGLTTSGNALQKIVVPTIIDKYTVSIGNFAFRNCTNLAQLTIPASVETIGYGIVRGCTALEKLTAPIKEIFNGATNSYFGYYFFYDSFYTPNSSSSSPQTAYIVVPTSLKEIIISGNNLSLPAYAFYSSFTGVEKITIPNTITSIGTSAFRDCSSLIEVLGMENSENINSYAFYNCLNVENFNSIIKMTSVDTSAFYNCTKLISINLSDNLSIIGTNAFYATRITELTVPSSCMSIGNFAFRNCTNLTQLTIPASVETIGYGIVRGCTALEKLTAPIKETFNGATNSYFGYYFFYDSFYTPNSSSSSPQTAYISIPASLKEIVISGSNLTIPAYAFYSSFTGVEKITIPNTVTSIGTSAFRDCSSLIELIIPSSTTTIARGVLQGCSKLETLTVPLLGTYDPNNHSYIKYLFGGTSYSSSVSIPKLRNIIINTNANSISDYAFYGLSGIETITINPNVQTMGISAFQGCTELKIIKLNSIVPPQLANNCFLNVNSKLIINVPTEVLDTYLLDASFSELTIIAINSAAIVFDSTGGSNINNIIFDSSSIVSPPAEPTWDNRIFCGWYLDEKCTMPFDFEQSLDKTVIVYAKWELPDLLKNQNYAVSISEAGQIYYYQFIPTTTGKFKINVSGASGTIFASISSSDGTVLKSSTGTNFDVIPSNNLVEGQPYIICIKMNSASATGSCNVSIIDA